MGTEPVYRYAVFCATLLALVVAGCSEPPLRRDVIAQARPDGQVAFDVVKVDGSVIDTLLGEKKRPFHQHFAAYQPAPELKIAVGDVVSVVIWEAGGYGLFGTAPPGLTVPKGAAPPEGEPAPPSGLPPAFPPPEAAPNPLSMPPGGVLPSGSPGELPQAAEPAPDETITGPGGITAAEPQPGPDASFEALIAQARADSGPAKIPDQLVAAAGAISIPFAGQIQAAGRTPKEVEKQIEARLASRALNPQALVVIKRSFANSVTVAGESIKGARVPLPVGGARLLQVIAEAGGAHPPPHDTFVRLSRGPITATVPLETLVADPKEDIFARPGDVLTLVQRPQTFSVFGATGKNAQIAFQTAHLSLSEGLARAGGLLDERADPRAVFLFRYEPVGIVRALGQPVATNAPDGVSPVAYRLDLKNAKSYLLARRFPVHDGDVIFVADAASRPLYKFFSALSNVTGPVTTAFIDCQYAKC